MKIKELIEKLQELEDINPELRVFTKGYEGGYEDVEFAFDNNIFLEIKDIALNAHDEWYYGPHEEANGHHTKKSEEIVKGIVL
jgi:hypothetical protein